MSQKEKVIIDMRKSTKEDLLLLSRLLLNLSTILSTQNLTIQVKKSQKRPIKHTSPIFQF